MRQKSRAEEKGAWDETNGKGEWRSKGDGKGSKGFKGTCNICGKFGHTAVDCRSKKGAYGIEEEDAKELSEEDEQVVPCGGVWLAGSVEMKNVTEVGDTYNKHVNAVRRAALDSPRVTESNLLAGYGGGNSPEESVFASSGLTRLVSERVHQKRSSIDSNQTGEGEVEKFIGGLGTKASEDICALQFHMTDSTKMLASVGKITEAGNEARERKATSKI